MSVGVGEIEAALQSLGLPGLPECLPAEVIDNHTHMDATSGFSSLDPERNLLTSSVVGVSKMVEVGCDLSSSEWAVDFSARHPQVVASVALHPNDAAELAEKKGMSAVWSVLDRISELAVAHDRVRAIGETGLDYFRTRSEKSQSIQREVFARHIDLANSIGRTLVIHDRDAHGDLADVLDEQGWPERTVLHCFSGDIDFAIRCLDHGAWLSFGGTTTFKANKRLREALCVAPVNKVLVETDAPYLTPEPLRGRPNAPYLMPHTVRFLGSERGINISDQVALAGWCQQLRINTEAAYGGAWGDLVEDRKISHDRSANNG